ncbi:hypothetical protein E4K67_17465 [Desulfosporosinus fructosivorans]|uniref:Phage tail assembly protein n=1 Tax=Desulfosporosinus fructosivorans TaxID=2018669 RepID=A0A4Z0R2B0_9FIRM|nr:hypothetical protein [Desulfosporosinus fructosivorans]TGE36888.1 hypothetical protein E4K67_17465 [Desulfosporosinus fructosivorans]
MAEVLKLSKPLKIFGANEDIELSELPYDFENMTAKDKINVGKKMKAAGIPTIMEEMDSDYHFYLFAEAVCVADRSISTDDVLRISAKDAQKASNLARSFFFFSLGELSQMMQ